MELTINLKNIYRRKATTNSWKQRRVCYQNIGFNRTGRADIDDVSPVSHIVRRTILYGGRIKPYTLEALTLLGSRSKPTRNFMSVYTTTMPYCTDKPYICQSLKTPQEYSTFILFFQYPNFPQIRSLKYAM